MPPTLEEVKNLDKLLPEESEELKCLFLDWQTAREHKNWNEADRLRAKMWWWDSGLGTDGLWFPVFESGLNRQRRAFRRMQKYKVDIYPWTAKMLP